VVKPDITHIPKHVAVIMDGNGRWARERKLPRLAGHRAGTENIRRVLRCFDQHGVKFLTLFVFSTENWSRPRPEVEGLMNLLEEVIDRETRELHAEGVRLVHLGSLDGLPKRLQQKVQESVELTESNTRATLCIAINYGGRAELVDAIKRIVSDDIPPGDIDESLVSGYLHTAGLPDPDLIIRTGGEMRLSNFLIWQSAYSEYYTTPALWPDFGPEEIAKALDAYSKRERRFGGVNTES